MGNIIITYIYSALTGIFTMVPIPIYLDFVVELTFPVGESFAIGLFFGGG